MDLTVCVLCVMCVTQLIMTAFIGKLTVIMNDIKDEKILVVLWE